MPFFGQSWDDPQTAAMLALGAGLMGTRGSFGEGLAAGTQGAMQAYRQSQSAAAERQEREQMRQMREMQMEEARRQAAAAQAAAERQARANSIMSGAFQPQTDGASFMGNITSGDFLTPSKASPQDMAMGLKQAQQAMMAQGMVPEAIALQEQIAKLAPASRKVKEYATLMVDGQPRMVPLFEDGSPGSPVNYGVAPKLPEGFVMGENGRMQVDPEYSSFKARVAAAGRPVTSVNLPAQVYEPAFTKEMAGLDAKQLGDWRKQAESAYALKQTVAEIRKASPESFAAGGAETKLYVSNLLSGLGLPVDENKLSSSTYLAGLANRLTMDSLGGSLGPGVSNADVAFLKATVPQLNQSHESRMKLADFLESKAEQQIQNYSNAYDYAQKNRGLHGFRPASLPAQKASGIKFLGFD